jgi:hypothetical protein
MSAPKRDVPSAKLHAAARNRDHVMAASPNVQSASPNKCPEFRVPVLDGGSLSPLILQEQPSGLKHARTGIDRNSPHSREKKMPVLRSNLDLWDVCHAHGSAWA